MYRSLLSFFLGFNYLITVSISFCFIVVVLFVVPPFFYHVAWQVIVWGVRWNTMVFPGLRISLMADQSVSTGMDYLLYSRNCQLLYYMTILYSTTHSLKMRLRLANGRLHSVSVPEQYSSHGSRTGSDFPGFRKSWLIKAFFLCRHRSLLVLVEISTTYLGMHVHMLVSSTSDSGTVGCGPRAGEASFRLLRYCCMDL